MSRRLPLPLLLLLLLAGAARGVELGQSRESLVAELGVPPSASTVSGVEILSYPQYTIHLTDGKVTRIQRWANSRRNPGLAGQAPGGIQRNMTREEVIRRLGTPARQAVNGSQERLYYSDLFILLVDGRVSTVTRIVRRQAEAATPAGKAPLKPVPVTPDSFRSPAASGAPRAAGGPGAGPATQPAAAAVSAPAPPPAAAVPPVTAAAKSAGPPPKSASSSAARPAAVSPRTTTPSRPQTGPADPPARPASGRDAATQVTPPRPPPRAARPDPNWIDRAAVLANRLRDPVERERLLYETPPTEFVVAWAGGMLLIVAFAGIYHLRKQSRIERDFHANRAQLRRKVPPRYGT